MVHRISTLLMVIMLASTGNVVPVKNRMPKSSKKRKQRKIRQNQTHKIQAKTEKKQQQPASAKKGSFQVAGDFVKNNYGKIAVAGTVAAYVADAYLNDGQGLDYLCKQFSGLFIGEQTQQTNEQPQAHDQKQAVNQCPADQPLGFNIQKIGTQSSGIGLNHAQSELLKAQSKLNEENEEINGFCKSASSVSPLFGSSSYVDQAQFEACQNGQTPVDGGFEKTAGYDQYIENVNQRDQLTSEINSLGTKIKALEQAKINDFINGIGVTKQNLNNPFEDITVDRERTPQVTTAGIEGFDQKPIETIRIDNIRKSSKDNTCSISDLLMKDVCLVSEEGVTGKQELSYLNEIVQNISSSLKNLSHNQADWGKVSGYAARLSYQVEKSMKSGTKFNVEFDAEYIGNQCTTFCSARGIVENVDTCSNSDNYGMCLTNGAKTMAKGSSTKIFMANEGTCYNTCRDTAVKTEIQNEVKNEIWKEIVGLGLGSSLIYPIYSKLTGKKNENQNKGSFWNKKQLLFASCLAIGLIYYGSGQQLFSLDDIKTSKVAKTLFNMATRNIAETKNYPVKNVRSTCQWSPQFENAFSDMHYTHKAARATASTLSSTANHLINGDAQTQCTIELMKHFDDVMRENKNKAESVKAAGMLSENLAKTLESIDASLLNEGIDQATSFGSTLWNYTGGTVKNWMGY